MTDKKISALTASTTPLAGTEVLPIVQSGATVKVSVDNLTVGRDVTAKSLKVTLGNLSDTVNLTNANGAFGNWTALGAGLLIQQKLSSPYECVIQTANAANSFQFPLSLNPSGGDVSIGSNLVIGTAGKGIDFSATTSGSGTMTSELLADYEEGTWTPVDQSGASLTFSNAFGYYTKVGDTVTAFGRVTFPTTASALTIIIGGLPFVVANNNQPGGGFIRLTATGRNDTVVASATTSQFLFYDNLLNAAVNLNYSDDRVDFVIIYKV